MNLKTVSHYSYFIYPFIISKKKHKNFIGKFLKDEEKWKFKFKENEIDQYTIAYFLPYVKKLLFPTLYWSDEYKSKFQKMTYNEKLNVVSKLLCTTFEYKINPDKNKSYKLGSMEVNFEILSIKLICFHSGTSFLILKTQLHKPGGVYSDDILDFNHKFRTINPKYLKKKKTEGMFLVNSEFKSIESVSEFISKLLYGYEDLKRENIYFDKLFTYSYMCLDESEWNDEKDLNRIIDEFYKFQYVLTRKHESQFDNGFIKMKNNTYSRWKYTLYGFSRDSGVVFSSAVESFNTVKLPNYFEGMYFYIFLLAFYQRIALLLFSQEIVSNGKRKIDDLKHEFIKFTHFGWFSQITNSEQGMDIWKKWQSTFDLPALFDEVQKEYSEFYNYIVADGQRGINFLLLVIYTVSLIFSAMLLLVEFNVIKTESALARMFLLAIIVITAAIYPIYIVIKILNRNFDRYLKKLKM